MITLKRMIKLISSYNIKITPPKLWVFGLEIKFIMTTYQHFELDLIIQKMDRNKGPINTTIVYKLKPYFLIIQNFFSLIFCMTQILIYSGRFNL